MSGLGYVLLSGQTELFGYWFSQTLGSSNYRAHLRTRICPPANTSFRLRAQHPFLYGYDTFPVVRLSTIVILVGIARVVPLPPPLGIVLGAVLTVVGIALRRFTET
jgi:hypothetical protein